MRATMEGSRSRMDILKMPGVRTRQHLGRYRFVAEIGQGGMSDVYLAVVEGPAGSGFAKLAVVKVLRENFCEDAEFITMLMDEARITARLQHPNVVQLLEAGREGDEYFIVMEYLDGQPLHRTLRRAERVGKALPQSFHLLILRDALEGLHYSHELTDYDGRPLQIVHRDVNPQNLFVTYDGLVKVMDFGIAKATGRSAETRQGIVKGKLRYMAPEQAAGSRDIDCGADIFSAGVLLWEALVGRGFWRDVDEMAVVQRLSDGEYEPSPRAAGADVPEALDRICRRALAHRRADRYASARDMANDLDEYLGGAALVHARRQLGGIVRDLFEKERSDVRSIVERLGKYTASIESVAGDLQRAMNSGSFTTTPSSQRIAVSAVPAESQSTEPVALVSAAPPAPRARRPGPIVGVVAAAGMLCAASVLFALGRARITTAASASSEARPVTVVVREHRSLVLGSVMESASRAAVDENSEQEPKVVVGYGRTSSPASSPSTPVSAEAAPPPPATEPAPRPSPNKRGRAGKLRLDRDDPWDEAE